MSLDTDTEDLVVTPEMELTELKSRAEMLGIKFHPSISLDKLREKVNAAVTAKPEDTVDDAPKPYATAVDVPASEESIAVRRARKKREANELIRVRVACMNPAKKEWEGEIFTAGNSLVGSFKKYVPFNVEDGWHVPRIILDQMKDRMCQIFVTSTDARGNKVRKGKLIKEFSIEVMPALTKDELQELAQRQAMAKSID